MIPTRQEPTALAVNLFADYAKGASEADFAPVEVKSSKDGSGWHYVGLAAAGRRVRWAFSLERTATQITIRA